MASKGMPLSSGKDCPVCASGPAGGASVPMRGAQPPQQPQARAAQPQPQQPSIARPQMKPGAQIRLRPGPFTGSF